MIYRGNSEKALTAKAFCFFAVSYNVQADKITRAYCKFCRDMIRYYVERE